MRRFIQRTAPVRSELGKLKAGSPYKVVVPISIPGFATLSQLESKLQGLEARYDSLVNVHTEPDSPWPDEALKEHLTDPLLVDGVHEHRRPHDPPAARRWVTRHLGHRRGGRTSGGTGRRRREAAYLDRERFERDHAYSREYEGWR